MWFLCVASGHCRISLFVYCECPFCQLLLLLQRISFFWAILGIVSLISRVLWKHFLPIYLLTFLDLLFYGLLQKNTYNLCLDLCSNICILVQYFPCALIRSLSDGLHCQAPNIARKWFALEAAYLIIASFHSSLFYLFPRGRRVRLTGINFIFFTFIQ